MIPVPQVVKMAKISADEYFFLYRVQGVHAN